MDELDEHLAFLSRRFSKLKFKKNPEASKPYKRDFQPNKNLVERSKFKCFNCGLGGHFASECRKPKVEKDRKPEAVDYKKKYFDLLRQREKAFITQDFYWATEGNDSDEDTEFVNLALMTDSAKQEASSSTNQVITSNLTELSKEECNSTINDMSTKLYHLRVILKSLTKENTRIKDANLFLSDRNAVLETQFIEFEKMRLECHIAKDELLAKELKTIARWNDSKNIATNIIKVQGMDTFYKGSVKKEKEKLDIEDLGADYASTDNDHPLIGDSSTDETHPLKHTTSVSKEKLEKLNKKYGPINKNFVHGDCSKTKSVEKVNIGHLSNKQLNDMLENVEAKKKKNRNGKVGINKHNNYIIDKYAPRKTCVNCASVNHLSTNCRAVKKPNVNQMFKYL